MNKTHIWVLFCYCQIAFVSVMWPVSVFTFAKDEPQTVLHLSWAAIWIAALGNIIAARVQEKVDDEPKEGE